MINLPLLTLDTDVDAPQGVSPKLQRWPLFRPPPFTGKTLVAINVGGAVVPISFSLYLLAHSHLGVVQTSLAVVLPWSFTSSAGRYRAMASVSPC
jgi:uncharacterized membrane protein